MRRNLPIALALSLASVNLASAAPDKAAARTGDVLPFAATEKTLANGLKVIVVPTGFPNIVSIQIPVQTGSRNEVEAGKTGFAHFFEHMMFRGTKAYPNDKYQEILAQIGARQNAYTSSDLTNYHTTFSKEDLETMIKLEADRFQNLDYSVEAFKTEARAVLGEYNKNSANPLLKLDEVQSDKGYTTHTYKHTTMGFLKDIEDMPNQYEYSKTFFERWYRPEYTTIIVAGDVTPEEVLPLVEKYWGSWKAGSRTIQIPQEPPAKASVYEHVAWPSTTLPWVTVGFHGPAFSETEKDYVAVATLFSIYFGETSDLYRKLVVDEQKVDQLFADPGGNVDPSLVTVYARVKKPEDTAYVRDEILRTFALSRSRAVDPVRLEEEKSNARYSFVARLDNTETIASTLARFVHDRRSYDTLNNVYRLGATLTPQDLLATAKKYFQDKDLVVVTLSKEALPEAIAKQPSLASLETTAAPASAAVRSAKSAPKSSAPASTGAPADLRLIERKSPLPLLNVKLLFETGSARDPKGKEGLAALSASMISEAGSKAMTYDEIQKALHPMAGVFRDQVDKEMTTFTARIHQDNWGQFFEIVLPMLLEPGFREEDFRRVKDAQANALRQDLRTNNEEELGKERLQGNLFAGTPYGHPVLGSLAGIESITLEDVRGFVKSQYTLANLRVGIAGDAPGALLAQLRQSLGRLPAGTRPAAAAAPAARKPQGIEVEILEKDTRATAISFGHPIAVTRSHPDYVALYLARTWLGEHRSSTSHLYSRIREVRGMNYGDYAYIEAFPTGMFQFFPDANRARRAQLFEIWIRPVKPEHAVHATKIALYELENLVRDGLTPEDFERTRQYLLKNVFVMTARQDQQIGYALDSEWYGIPEYTKYMRDGLQKLTLEQVNAAIRQHLSAKDLSVVIVTKDAQGLKKALVSDEFSPITYDAEKPAALLEEDKIIGARKLGIAPEKVTITKIEEVFAR
ncbi:MAG TPA: pitrilysin family protein [Thermoanaerobaculia bacterium]